MKTKNLSESSKPKKIITYAQYDSKLSKSLNHYKSKGITEEELFSINGWISIEDFVPKGNIQTLSREEQRLIFYNDARDRLSFRGTNRKFKILRFSRVGPS